MPVCACTHTQASGCGARIRHSTATTSDKRRPCAHTFLGGGLLLALEHLRLQVLRQRRQQPRALCLKHANALSLARRAHATHAHARGVGGLAVRQRGMQQRLARLTSLPGAWRGP